MRRPLATFFLLVILLNTAGYYLVFEGWKWHNSLTWSLDENTSSPELIVRVPLTIPYATETGKWEKAQGQFKYEGEVYRLVKQKLTLDAVYVALVKDAEGSLIDSQQEDFAKTFSDQPSSQKQGTKVLPGFMKEYISDRISVEPFISGWARTAPLTFLAGSLVPTFSASIVHPPERA